MIVGKHSFSTFFVMARVDSLVVSVATALLPRPSLLLSASLLNRECIYTGLTYVMFRISWLLSTLKPEWLTPETLTSSTIRYEPQNAQNVDVIASIYNVDETGKGSEAR